MTDETVKLNVIADKSKEAQLLKMAKARYQNYTDVAVFAKALDLRPGVVYLALKKHGFIQKTDTTEYRVLSSYYKNNGNLRAITQETGLNVWICAKTIENLGFSPNWVGYKSTMLSNSNAVGRSGEEEFSRLVPSAVDMNLHYEYSNRAFDFLLNEKTIDVKTYNLYSVNNTISYIARLNAKAHPDFYCLFLLKNKEKGCIPGNYHILLIPSSIFPPGKTQVYISPNKNLNRKSAFYWDFEVEPAALESTLENA